MSIHIGAKPGDIASTVLLPGDPLRAEYIAENMLEGATRYNDVRGMYGFTGSYKGKQVSVQGTGMGVPSISIYANELISEFGVSVLIRVGTCGGLQPETRLRDIILAMAASTDSNVNQLRFKGMSFAPTASFQLLRNAYEVAKEKGIEVMVGNVFSTDTFYHEDADYWRLWADYGVLAIEMETSALYALAAKFNVQALSILTVSDVLTTGQKATAEERQQTFAQMAEIALEIAV